MTPEEAAAKIPRHRVERALQALAKQIERELGPGHVVTVEHKRASGNRPRGSDHQAQAQA